MRAIMAVARHIVVLDHGQKIAEGAPKEIVENPEVIRAYLGSGYVHAPTAGEASVLKLQGVSASYGSVPAITDVTIEIGEGEAVGLLGANGAGKSTTLRAISGLVKLTVRHASPSLGTNLASLPPYQIPELGIAHVPEGRQVFPEMTVHENLEIGAYVPKAKAERAADARTGLQHLSRCSPSGASSSPAP